MKFSFVGKTAAQIAALDVSVFASLTAKEVSQLTAGQAAALSATQINAINPAALAGFTKRALRALNATVLSGLSTTTVELFSAAQIGHFAPAAFAAMPLADFAALSRAEIHGLVAGEIRAMGTVPQEVASLAPGAIGGLTAKALGAFSSEDSAELTANEIAGLSGAQLSALTAAALEAVPLTTLTSMQLAGLTAAAFARLSLTQFDAAIAPDIEWLSKAQAARMTTAEVASLTSSEVALLPAAVIGALTSAELNAISPMALSGLSKTQIASISPAHVRDIQEDFLNGLSPTQISELAARQIRALTAAQVANLASANFADLDVADFAANEVAGLTLAEITSLSKQAFDAGVAPFIADLSLAAVAGLTDAELESLTGAEVAEISAKQYAALDASQQAAVISESPVMRDAVSQETEGTISYSGMLKVLQDAAAGGMSAAKFAALKLLDNDLQQGVIKTSSYVAQIADDVIGNNSANAFWNGGASTATPLGDLSATSSQEQVQELIGKWFLGTDLPSIDVPGVSTPARYQAENLPLFAPGGEPSYGDVSQGAVGDCYFVAALGETAMLDPTLIENMIQENPNGTYSVEFWVNGAPDYVTVNDELSVMQGGEQWGDGSTIEFCNSSYGWGPLIEKAYAQLAEQQAADVSSGEHEDAYAAISSGGGEGISVITGQQPGYVGLSPSPSNLAAIADDILAALDHGDDVMLVSNPTTTYGNLIDNHMFEVLGISGESVTLLNPWNAANTDDSVSVKFTASLATLAADQQDGFYIASGAKAAN